MKTKPIHVGIIGAGYMGKAHSVAMSAVGAVFNTRLRPVLEMICTTTRAGAEAKAQEFGFKRYTDKWEEVVRDPIIEAIIIATPADTHFAIAKLALELGKPVLCEKPLAADLTEARHLVTVAKRSGVANMVGFNYIKPPALQLARQIINSGEIGEITQFRGEHTEDFFALPHEPANWRSFGVPNGTMGDLAPHMVNAALTLVGDIDELSADICTLIHERPDPLNPDARVKVDNDDFGHFLCRFKNGASGSLMFSRVAHGRKMGYIFELTGTKGALRFNMEDQNALWLYDAALPSNRSGFRQILTGPEHPDYVNFCLGAGHGTGYQDQIIIEAKDFLSAIETGNAVFPTFDDGLAVSAVIDAAQRSNAERRWVKIDK